jgi:anti-sigma regulatory factor (Ser/Thr protein kinase)
VPTTAGQTLAVTTGPADLAGVRRTLTRWLIDRGVGDFAACDIVLAVAEAADDAAAHGAGTITVRVTVQPGRLVATVTDDGRWRDQDTGLATLRGRGLAMVEAATARYAIAHDGGRTTLTAWFPLEPAQSP